MEKEFVNYEIALILKEKGFMEECFGFYYYDGTFEKYRLVYEESSNDYLNSINAPLWQQVLEWLNVVHNIEVDALRYTYSGGVYQGKCYMWFVNQYDPKYNHELEENDEHWILNERKSQDYDFKDKREAIKEGIIYALTLI